MRQRGEIVRDCNGRDRINVNRIAPDPCWSGESDTRARFASMGLTVLGGAGTNSCGGRNPSSPRRSLLGTQEGQENDPGQSRLLDRAMMPRDFMASAGRGPPVGFGNFM